jgi:hypothetical protein
MASPPARQLLILKPDQNTACTGAKTARSGGVFIAPPPDAFPRWICGLRNL